MKKIKRFFIQYYYPGLFVPETSIREVESGDSKIDWGKRVYQVVRFIREDVIDDEQVYTGKQEQVGKIIFHPASQVFSVGEIIALNKDENEILLSNAQNNGYKFLVKCPMGNWQPFDPKTCEVAH